MTVNVPVVEPPATVTDAGTVALALLEDNVTNAPPEGAMPLSVTVPADVEPPSTEAGESEMPVSTAGLIVRVAV